jgi:hypothetical protein
MSNKTRPLRIQFHVSQEELDAIEQKRAESRITGREAFMRKLVLEGRVLILDVPEIRQMSALMGRCAGSLNQIAKRVNSTGRLYPSELSETKAALEQLTEEMRKVYQQLTKIKA